MYRTDLRAWVFSDGYRIDDSIAELLGIDSRVASAMWWLGRAIHRLAGLDPWPGDTRRN